MSTSALLRNPSRAAVGIGGIAALGSLIWHGISRRIQVGRDARVLQTLPEHVLADMGLERMEIMAGTSDQRHVWVIPHRY